MTRTIYPPHIMLGIAQEALNELKAELSEEAIEERRKQLYSFPNTHTHTDSNQETQGKKTTETTT